MIKNEFIFMGPPASGKGTQTILLSKELGLIHVDTGSLLREAMANSTEEGVIAKSYVDKGQLVPVEIVVGIIKERLTRPDCAKGFILDGFPRSIEQAEHLDAIQKEIDKDNEVKFTVFYFDIPIDNLMDRIIYRRSCPDCKKIFNLKYLPVEDNKCTECSAELVQRKDDTAEIAKARFDTYFKETAPLVEFYEKKGVLVKINAVGSVEEIYSRIKEVL